MIAPRHGFAGVSHDFLETREEGHGRRETRRYWITEESACVIARQITPLPSYGHPLPVILRNEEPLISSGICNLAGEER